MASARIIEDFLAPKKMAFAGVSRKPKSFSRAVLKSLSAKGYELSPVLIPIMKRLTEKSVLNPWVNYP